LESSPKFTNCWSILFQCQIATHLYSTNTEIFYFISLKIKNLQNIMLISDGPVALYLVEEKADGCKGKCLLSLANLFFTLVYSTCPSTILTALLSRDHEFCGPYGQGSCFPSFIAWMPLSWCPTELSLGCQTFQDFCQVM
jgi:hypothetical protein